MDRQLGVLLANACDFVYAFDDAGLPALGNPDVVEIRDHEDTVTSVAGILRYPDKTVLAFQGTITQRSREAVLDWLQNFRVRKVSAIGLPGLVHEGFVGQLELIWDAVLAELNDKLTPPLYVTGHSQGGAVAALATKALELAGFAVAGTYTFAAPRPGDVEFAESVTTPVFRFEFGDDIVPHVPFHAISLGTFQDKINAQLLAHAPDLAELVRTAAAGFEAVGPLFYRRPGTELQEDIDADDEAALARTRDMLLLVAGRNLVEHHLMPSYIGMFS